MKYFQENNWFRWVGSSIQVFSRQVSFDEATDEDAIELCVVEPTTSIVGIMYNNKVCY